MFITGVVAPGDPASLLDAGVDAVAVVDAQAGEASVAAAVAQWRQATPDGHGLLGCEHPSGQAALADVDFVNTPSRGQVSKAANPYLLVGRACADTYRFDEAITDPDVDFMLVGHAAGTEGIALLRYAAFRQPQASPASKPWFAVGGINAANLPDVLAAGARRVAVSRAIAMATDPVAAAQSMAEAVKASWTDMDAVTLGAFGGSSGHLAG